MNTVICFFVGVFFANGIPHFVNGISGRHFHSPFARPFVKGLSSAVSNVIWGLINFALASILLIISDGPVIGYNLDFIIVLCGFASASLVLSILFQGLDDKE